MSIPSSKTVLTDTKSAHTASRATIGIKLLALDPDDKLAATMVIPQKTPNPKTPDGTLIQ